MNNYLSNLIAATKHTPLALREGRCEAAGYPPVYPLRVKGGCRSFTPSPSGGRLGWGWVTAALMLATSTHAATLTLAPTADAYVQAGTNASKNYGTATALNIRTSGTTANNYDSYLKFDTTSVTGSITTAKLRIYAKLSASGTVATTAHAVATITWGETTLTWNNKPAKGAALGSVTVNATSYAWREIDVTSYVQSEYAANRKVMSFAYHDAANSTPYITAYSKNATNVNKPQLLVTYSTNVAPTVSLTAPANGASYTAPASVNLTANAADSDGSITLVAYYNGATLIGQASSAPYSYTWTNVAAGSYTLTAKATDNAGAITTSSPVNITVNANQAPSVSLLAPSATDSFTAPATFSIVANAADSDGSVQMVEFYNGATLLGSKTQSPFMYDWLNVAAGSYTLTAKAYDNANASTTSAPVTITVNAPQVAPGIYYIYADHLNTPRVITDQTNKTVWRWDSDPFGTDMAYEDPDRDGVKFGYNLRFPGQYYDKETGLHYNYHRDYSPEIGRYVQSDPLGLFGGSLSTYSYANQNPISYSDPLGLFTSSTHNEITTAAIAIAGSPCPNLPAAVAMADWLPGSQAPQNAHWHAMRDGTNPNSTTESAKNDFKNFVNEQWKSCTCEGLARALHTLQDSYARGHAGSQPWGGGLPSPSHVYHDGYPSRSERAGAVNATVNLMRTYAKGCNNQCPK